MSCLPADASIFLRVDATPYGQEYSSGSTDCVAAVNNTNMVVVKLRRSEWKLVGIRKINPQSGRIDWKLFFVALGDADKCKQARSP